jgi:hypothetical protein
MTDDVSQSQSSRAAHRPPSRRQRMRVLLVLATAGIVSAVAGWLSHEAGGNLPAAVLTGGGAFAGTVGLLLALVRHAEGG